MPATWIEEIQETIDSEGLVALGDYFGIDFTTAPYECFLCGFNINGEEAECIFTLRIPNAAQFVSEEVRAAHFRNEDGEYAGELLEVVSTESNNADLLITIALSVEQTATALVSSNALLLACSDELEVSAFDVESITPPQLEINFDYPTPTPSAQPLATPTGLNATNITSNSALVSWAQDANASNFKIEYKINGDTSWTQTTSD